MCFLITSLLQVHVEAEELATYVASYIANNKKEC